MNAHFDEHPGLIYPHDSIPSSLDTTRRKRVFCASKQTTCNVDQGVCIFPRLKQEDMKLSETVVALCLGKPPNNRIDHRRRCFMLSCRYSARKKLYQEISVLSNCLSCSCSMPISIHLRCRPNLEESRERSLRFFTSGKQDSDEETYYYGLLMQLWSMPGRSTVYMHSSQNNGNLRSFNSDSSFCRLYPGIEGYQHTSPSARLHVPIFQIADWIALLNMRWSG
jgi:hypothetical protein